jgi:hypothetical protein
VYGVAEQMLFPGETPELNQSQLMKEIFLQLKRQADLKEESIAEKRKSASAGPPLLSIPPPSSIAPGSHIAAPRKPLEEVEKAALRLLFKSGKYDITVKKK